MNEQQSNNNLICPSGYNELLNNMLIIPGTGKSELTWVAALVATMENTYRLNAPTLFKTIPSRAGEDILNIVKQIVEVSIVHDHLCQLARGIYLCDYPEHLLYQDWAWATSPSRRLMYRDSGNSSNPATLFRLQKERPLVLTDLVDGIPHMEVISKLFPSCVFMPVIRNGINVISERKKLNFDTDWYYTHPFLPCVDWIWGDNSAPWYVTDARDTWKEWDNVTRAAHLWRLQAELIGNYPMIKWEEFTVEPGIVPWNIQNAFPFIRKTKITDFMEKKIIESAPGVNGKEHIKKISLSEIAEPERSKFAATMERYGYL